MRQLIYVEQVSSHRILRLRPKVYTAAGVLFCPTGKHFIRAWFEVDSVMRDFSARNRVVYRRFLQKIGCRCC